MVETSRPRPATFFTKTRLMPVQVFRSSGVLVSSSTSTAPSRTWHSAPFSCNPVLIAAATIRPGHMAKRAKKSNLTDIHTSTLSLSWTTRQKIHKLLHAKCQQPSTSHSGHLVSPPKRTPQRHLQTTTHSRCYVTPRKTFATLCSAFHAGPRYVKSLFRHCGNACSSFSLSHPQSSHVALL